MTKPNTHEANLLCVGGPLDGERRVADPRMQQVVLANLPQSFDELDMPGEYDSRKAVDVRRHIYLITHFHCSEPPRYEQQTVRFLRHQSVTSMEALKMLMEGYQASVRAVR